MQLRDKLTLLNIDCMEYMKTVPDKYFDLALVDPPYGIGVGSLAYTNGVQKAGNGLAKRRDYTKETDWDLKRPNKDYFKTLQRISKEQIIWGGNYFSDILTPTKSWLVWDKKIDEKYTNNFADCELAWCSKGLARVIRLMWNGMLQHDMKNKENRIHPTQKPVRLYDWIYDRYATENCKVIDTHLGSGSNAIAAHYSPKVSEFVGCELDADYYNDMIKRVRKDTEQLKLF